MSEKTINIIDPYVGSIVTVFNSVKSAYETNLEIIKSAEEELADIDHEIELSAPKNACNGYALYKEIREIRLRRRKAKDENELLEEMYRFLAESVPFKNRMQQIQGNARKAFERQQARTYHPKRRKDLTITGERCKAYKPFEEMLSDFKRNKISVQSGKLRSKEVK